VSIEKRIRRADMSEEKNSIPVDEGLQGNETIEEAILVLQQEPTEEMLAHTLTVIRRRARANGQFIVAVIPPAGAESSLQIQAIQTEDERYWWMAFTGFDEEIKGGEAVMSTFMADISHLFEAALMTDEIEGIILNPWNRALMLDKSLLQLILAGK